MMNGLTIERIVSEFHVMEQLGSAGRFPLWRSDRRTESFSPSFKLRKIEQMANIIMSHFQLLKNHICCVLSVTHDLINLLPNKFKE